MAEAARSLLKASWTEPEKVQSFVEAYNQVAIFHLHNTSFTMTGRKDVKR